MPEIDAELERYRYDRLLARRFGSERPFLEHLPPFDFAEWLVSHLLDIQLGPSAVEKHIDGVDAAGRTYQINILTKQESLPEGQKSSIMGLRGRH